MIGKTISHYRILEKLGEGGMGVVYKAEDLKLKRTVALKFLPAMLTGDSEARERFTLEAQAASSLNHPNICTIHEIDDTDDGGMFICMACYEGETLKERLVLEPLEIKEALDIALQMIRGLGKAHERGIVHRDIKSANIFITEDGHVRILDFGLAKLLGQSDLTTPGTTLGTVTYMSPEQARGKPVDQRTDIWALGVLLYEMVAGRPPFAGEHPQAVIRAILNDEPAPLAEAAAAPPELGPIVGRALAKDPRERYQSTIDLLSDLGSLRESLRTGSSARMKAQAEPQPSIAVLPFTNMSADPEQEYFCDGMAEEIINALANLEGLRVVARTSAFALKEAKLDVRDVGEKLGVGTVLEGSVRKAGNRLRITAQLVSISDGCHLWSERYDREMEDVFAIQDDISLAIVDKLKVRLLGGDNLTATGRRTQDLEAYALYLKGRFYWNKRNPQDVRRGLKCFRQAIERDPSYAAAYVGVADCNLALRNQPELETAEAFHEVDAAIKKALALDENLAEAHASLAWVKMERDWDWDGAEEEFRRAIQLNPGHATARQWHATYLNVIGRPNEALTESRRAQELDPLSPMIGVKVGNKLRALGRHDEAITQYNSVLEIDPLFSFAHIGLAGAHVAKGEYEEAIAEIERGISCPGPEGWRDLALAYIHAVAGREDQARELLAEAEGSAREGRDHASYMAAIHLALGERERALDWIEWACEEPSTEVLRVMADPRFAALRSDPRFVAIRRKVGLPE